MTESKLYHWLKGKLQTQIDDGTLMFQRIENTIGVGTPDLYFRTKRNDGWIELKIIHTSSTEKKVGVPFRPGQLAWIIQYRKLGGLIYLLVYNENSGHLLFMRNGSIQKEYDHYIDMLSQSKECRHISCYTPRELYSILCNGVTT